MRLSGVQARIGWLLGAGVLLRVVLAVLTPTNGDIGNMIAETRLLTHTPLDAYAGPDHVWPYLSGYFPALLAIDVAAHLPGVSYEIAARLATIAANVGLVWLVDRELQRRRATDRTRVLAAAILMFTPVAVLEAGWHAQLDMAATLCAAGAVVAWERADLRHRALLAGALLGLAFSIKTVPAVVGLALLPHVRDRRELLRLAVAGAAVPLVLALPWLLHDPAAVVDRLVGYRGIPGLGGLSLVAQPTTAEPWLNGVAISASGLQDQLQDHSALPVLLGLLVGAGVLMRARPEPVVGSILVLLIVYATAVNWALHYLLWVLPFLLMAGWIRVALGWQVLLALPVLMADGRSIAHRASGTRELWPTEVSLALYVPIMVAMWAGALAGAAVLSRRLLADRRRPVAT